MAKSQAIKPIFMKETGRNLIRRILIFSVYWEDLLKIDEINDDNLTKMYLGKIEDWRHGISRGIEEKPCGNSRGQLKEKWNFQGCSRKIMWNFRGSWFSIMDFPRGVKQFWRISRVESLFSSEFISVKWQI